MSCGGVGSLLTYRSPTGRTQRAPLLGGPQRSGYGRSRVSGASGRGQWSGRRGPRPPAVVMVAAAASDPDLPEGPLPRTLCERETDPLVHWHYRPMGPDGPWYPPELEAVRCREYEAVLRRQWPSRCCGAQFPPTGPPLNADEGPALFNSLQTEQLQHLCAPFLATLRRLG